MNFIKTLKNFCYLFLIIFSLTEPIRGSQKDYKSRFEDIIIYGTDYCLEPIIDSFYAEDWYKYISPLYWVRYICVGDQEPILVFENYAEQGNFQLPPWISPLYKTYGLENYSYNIKETKSGSYGKQGSKAYLEISLFTKYENQPNVTTDRCAPYDIKTAYCLNSYNPSSSTYCDITNRICEDTLPNGVKSKVKLRFIQNGYVYRMLIGARGIFKNQVEDTKRLFLINSKY